MFKEIFDPRVLGKNRACFLGIEGLNRRRKKRTSIETNIRVALEKSFLEVGEVLTFHIHGIVCVILTLCTGETQVVWFG